MLMTVNCSCCPAAFVMTAAGTCGEAGRGQQRLSPWSDRNSLPQDARAELSSELENVGVTMPVWFAGGS